MITNTGKSILAKYLIGQAPAYASYIALGCGAKPITNSFITVSEKTFSSNIVTLVVSDLTDIPAGTGIHVTGMGEPFDGFFKVLTSSVINTKKTITYSSVYGGVINGGQPDTNGVSTAKIYLTIPTDYADKTCLDFEMFRIPIISRGYVYEDGVSKIVFTGELPTEERYEISEVGIYSAGSNPSAVLNDSRTLLSFAQTENWKYNDSSSLTIVNRPLDSDPAHPGRIIPNNGSGDIAGPFQTNADNLTLTTQTRKQRFETSRFLNNIIFVPGNTSTFTGSGNTWLPSNGTNYISLSGINVNLSKSAPTDKVKLAFSIVSKDETPVSNVDPTSVKILIEFSYNAIENGNSVTKKANMRITESSGFNLNRYIVSTQDLQDISVDSGFSWASVTTVKIYAAAYIDSTPSDQFYITLDAMRVENTTNVNPLYGLTGYTVIKNTVNSSAATIVKSPNTANMIEFRFAMDVM